MIFDAPHLMLTGLAEFALPTRTVRLCDGGFVYFGGNKFVSFDPDFGGIQSVENIALGVGDKAPGFRLTFAPTSTAAAADLSQPAFQGSKIKFWMGRVNKATGAVTESRLLAVALLDQTRLQIGKGSRTLVMDCVSENDRLFSRNRGNGLTPRFHKSVWPGELGLDNATGAPITDAWGVESPPRGYGAAGSGGGGQGGGFGVVNYV